MPNDANRTNDEQVGYVGIDPPHYCPLPKTYVIRRSKNPPLWSVWRCPECKEEWHYGYSYAHDDAPGWNKDTCLGCKAAQILDSEVSA